MSQKFINACAEGNLELANELYKKGDVYIHMYNEEALRLAFKNKHWNVFKWLIGLGANIHVYNDELIKKACINRDYVILDFFKLLDIKFKISWENFESFYEEGVLESAEWIFEKNTIGNHYYYVVYKILRRNNWKIKKWMVSLILKYKPHTMSYLFDELMKHKQHKICKWILSESYMKPLAEVMVFHKVDRNQMFALDPFKYIVKSFLFY